MASPDSRGSPVIRVNTFDFPQAEQSSTKAGTTFGAAQFRQAAQRIAALQADIWLVTPLSAARKTRNRAQEEARTPGYRGRSSKATNLSRPSDGVCWGDVVKTQAPVGSAHFGASSVQRTDSASEARNDRPEYKPVSTSEALSEGAAAEDRYPD
jgi:hypothetical protein